MNIPETPGIYLGSFQNPTFLAYGIFLVAKDPTGTGKLIAAQVGGCREGDHPEPEQMLSEWQYVDTLGTIVSNWIRMEKNNARD